MLNMLLLGSKDESEDRGRTFPSARLAIFPVPQGQGPHRHLPQPTAAYPRPPHHRTCSRLRLLRSAWTPPETEIHSGADSAEGNKKTEKRDRRLENVQGRAGGKTPQQLRAGAGAVCAVRCAGTASLLIPPHPALAIRCLNSRGSTP